MCGRPLITRQDFLRAALTLAAAPLLRSLPARADNTAEATEIAPGIFVHQGRYEVQSPENRGDMVFVHADDQQLAAGFQQNSLQRVRSGDEAEVAFDAIPGRVFKGKVRYVLDAIATGQLQATGALQDMSFTARARIPVIWCWPLTSPSKKVSLP